MKYLLATIQVLLIIVLGWNAIEYRRKNSESYLQGQIDSGNRIAEIMGECIDGTNNTAFSYYLGGKRIAKFKCEDLKKINKPSIQLQDNLKND